MTNTSQSSTPNRRGVNGLVDHTYKNVAAQLKEDIEGKHSSTVPFLDFVHHVWGLDRSLLQKINDREWKLLPDKLSEYQNTKYEPQLYEPFAAMAEALIQEVEKVFGKASKEAKNALLYFWNHLGLGSLKTSATRRKPDMLAIDAIFSDLSPIWLFVRQVLEFKRTSDSKSTPTGDTQTTSMSSFADASTSSARTRSSSRASDGFAIPGLPASAIASGSGLSSHADTQLPSPSITPTALAFDRSQITKPSPASSHKRKSTRSHATCNAKRARTDVVQNPVIRKVNADALQLAVYAIDCLNASTRHFTAGILIDRCEVSLWYYDRACIIRSEEFYFDSEPNKLAIMLYAMGNCTEKQAGFDPHLSLPAEFPKRSRKLPNFWQDVIGATFSFPPATSPQNASKSTILSPLLRIMETIFSYRGLISRGTMVYRVAPIVKGVEINEHEALKTSWPLCSRHLEARTIQTLVEIIPQWKDHLPEVIASATLTAEELELPRVELLKLCSIERFEDRWLHMLLMKLYGKLWEVGSVEAFQDVFVDCVECHHHAYTTSRTLHRDLSENNLMFKKCDDGDVKGILNDWDMASKVDETDQVESSTAQHCTGTLPFMARDLLVDGNPPPHLYRHDLESFFYILVWAALRYDFKSGTRLPTPECIQKWESSMEDAEDAKNMMITSGKRLKLILSHAQPQSRNRLVPWISSLGDLFYDGSDSERRSRDNPEWDSKTQGGFITFEKFMNALDRKPRHLNSPSL
ncbi:hypothetical protein H0H81_011796 [Sphagnurus paluster]|uniref:Fungal-type protein kinase domain-containing protein n=1 Tax=Sphagnurus paluster TaxID=117069 RepID=A0A9P7K533_9AGAR|nr:hypothetical protein H0H81_011796 [Sphagnurus paluster]